VLFATNADHQHWVSKKLLPTIGENRRKVGQIFATVFQGNIYIYIIFNKNGQADILGDGFN
jgi:hypothetical protein